MKIAILGAGAMGSLYASYLTTAHQVTLIDSFEAKVKAINERGITKLNNDNTKYHFTCNAVLSGTDIGIQDLLIIFVKNLYTYQAVKENVALIGENTIVLTLQNGAGNNRDIANFTSRENIIVGTSSHNSVAMELDTFYHSGCGPTNIGPDVLCEASLLKAQTVAKVFSESGLEVNVIENVQKVLWQKLMVNCGINALTAVADCRIGDVKENPHLWNICQKIVNECVLVAEADGTHFEASDALAIVRRVCENDASGYSSMYQDHKNKRITEIDKINGIIASLGKEYGIPTPYNDMIVAQVHALEHKNLSA